MSEQKYSRNLAAQNMMCPLIQQKCQGEKCMFWQHANCSVNIIAIALLRQLPVKKEGEKNGGDQKTGD